MSRQALSYRASRKYLLELAMFVLLVAMISGVVVYDLVFSSGVDLDQLLIAVVVMPLLFLGLTTSLSLVRRYRIIIDADGLHFRGAYGLGRSYEAPCFLPEGVVLGPPDEVLVKRTRMRRGWRRVDLPAFEFSTTGCQIRVSDVLKESSQFVAVLERHGKLSDPETAESEDTSTIGAPFADRTFRVNSTLLNHEYMVVAWLCVSAFLGAVTLFYNYLNGLDLGYAVVIIGVIIYAPWGVYCSLRKRKMLSSFTIKVEDHKLSLLPEIMEDKANDLLGIRAKTKTADLNKLLRVTYTVQPIDGAQYTDLISLEFESPSNTMTFRNIFEDSGELIGGLIAVARRNQGR